VRSQITEAFRRHSRQLPADAQRDALKAYRLWKNDPFQTGFQFKEIEITPSKRLWSVRTKLGYRTLGTRPEPDLLVWHWIGTHAEYDKLINVRRARKEQRT